MRSHLVTLAGGLLASVAFATPYATAQGISNDVVKIAVMADQSGPYADNGGPGTVEAVRMAIEDFGGKVNGKNIEMVFADDQNKPDIGASIAQKWLDAEGVDTIVGGSASSIAIAVQKLMNERKKPYMLAGTASSVFTNEACSLYTTQWVMDSYALPKATATSMVAAGDKTWFFITVDYAFGKAWQADTTKFIEQGGGTVVGSVLHPLNTTDFSSFLLRAQASRAKVIALANSGSDFSNAVKQAQEFGITSSGQKLAPLGLLINQVHGIGLKVAQGMNLVTPFYWDVNDETRAFSKRFQDRFRGRVPNEAMVGAYSAVTHYLKAVQATGTDEGEAVSKAMRATPVSDFAIKGAPIRADGQVMRPMYAVTVKSPTESKGPYDYYKINSTVPAEEVWRQPKDSACALLK